jgi:hypothetical protein
MTTTSQMIEHFAGKNADPGLTSYADPGLTSYTVRS